MPTFDTATTTALALEEYRSLRQTIERRGSLRVAAAVATWAVWAALSCWTWSGGLPPLAGAVTLVVLAGGFEAVLWLHAGVERIGRYVQATFEAGGHTAPAWEHVAMGLGRRWLSPGGLDPLFAGVFLVAALLNALPLAAGGSPIEMAAAAVLHLAFALRVLGARRYVARQRAHDLGVLHEVISSNSLVSRIQQDR